MTLYGMNRHRLVNDSLFRMVQLAMVGLGWTVKTDWHLSTLIQADPIDSEQEVQLNTLAMDGGVVIETPGELGSSLAETNWEVFWDIYAESKVVGEGLAFDLRDVLAGRMPSQGCTQAAFHVYDYNQATPPVIFDCVIDRVAVQRTRVITHPYEQFSWYVHHEVIDDYGSN